MPQEEEDIEMLYEMLMYKNRMNVVNMTGEETKAE
jgi:hypothetical protein